MSHRMKYPYLTQLPEDTDCLCAECLSKAMFVWYWEDGGVENSITWCKSCTIQLKYQHKPVLDYERGCYGEGLHLHY